jgi:hypothetical protein
MTQLQAAGLGIGLGWYVSHKSPPHQDPTAIGGGDNQTQQAGTVTVNLSSPHVTPTNTIARRAAFPDPLPTPVPSVPIPVMHALHLDGSKHDSIPARQHLNRAAM